MEEVIRSCVPFSGKLRGVILVILIHAVSSHKLIYSTPTTLQDQSTASRRPHSSTQGMVPYSTSSSNYERENSVTTLNRVISRPVEAGDLSLVTSALMELLSRTLVHEVNCIAQQPEVGRRVLTKLSEHFIPASLYVAADHIPRFPKQYKMSWIEAIKRHEDPYYISMELVVLGDLNFVADVISKRVKWIWNADLEGSSTSAACERLQKELYFGTQGLLLLVYPYGEERGGSSLVSVFRVSSSSDQGARFEMAARLQNSPVSNSDVKLQLKIFKSFWSSVPRDLEGAEVSMAYINKLGCFTVGSDRKKLTLDSATGYCAEVAKAASEYVNFSAVLKPTNAFGSPLDNGSWDGMVGMLVNRKAELAPLDFTPSLSRRSVVEMSQTLGTEELVMVTQSPGLVRQPFLLLHIFSLKVLTVLFLLNLAGATFVFRFSRYNARKPITFKDFAFVPESLRFSFGQAFPTTPKDASSRVVYVVLLFMVFIVASTYKSAITAYLARPLWSKTINSAEDLAASSLIPHTPSSTETWEFFMRQNTTPLSRIKEKLQPVGGTDLDAIFFDKISDGRFALVDTYSSAVGSLNLYELRNQRCRFHIGREGYVTVLDVFLYSRNSRVSVHVDRVLRRLRSFGITRYLRRRAYAVPCFTKIEIIARRPLSVGQCEGLMYVYLCSMLVACVAFVLELLWYRLGGPSRLRLQLFKTQATRS